MCYRHTRQIANPNQSHGDTLFYDTATGLILAEHQVSLGAGETLVAKEGFEQLLWASRPHSQLSLWSYTTQITDQDQGKSL